MLDVDLALTRYRLEPRHRHVDAWRVVRGLIQILRREETSTTAWRMDTTTGKVVRKMEIVQRSVESVNRLRLRRSHTKTRQ